MGAIQLNFLNDADRIINDCPYIVGANDIWVFIPEDMDQWYVRFEGIDKDYQCYFTDWIVWDDKEAAVMTNKEKGSHGLLR